MTKEDKELLLKDLCARLPYGVICKSKYIEYDDVDGDDIEWDVEGKLEGISDDYATINSYQCELEYTKPYLRPMSSITEEEKEEIKPLFSKFTDEFGKRVLVVRQNKMTLYQDWLNKHHFDYRGLIEKGIAMPATEGMYNF